MDHRRTPLADERIVELYWERNEQAVSETDFKYKKYLSTVAYNIVHDPQDCEECLNDTYVGAWNAMPPARPTALKAFLTTIIRRISVNRYHSNRRNPAVPSNMTLSLSDVESFVHEDDATDEYDAQRLGGIISDFLRSLDERRRYIFMSRYYVANTVDKIAADLSVSRSTVNRELASIRQALKEILEREGYVL